MIKGKKIWLTAVFILLCTVLIASSSSANKASAKSSTYCIEAAPEISEKAYEYLDEIYIEKHPDLALEFPFGSEGDKKVLKAAADKITKDAKTDKEKVEKIINWLNKNIDYRASDSGSGHIYAIDTYYYKKGNCVGISQLMLNFCRLSGIKAVMCCGARGDMKSTLTLESKVPDHAWTMIHLDGKWYLYDPLFDVYGATDKAFIDKWYFFDFIEGVSPYVKEYAKYTWTGDCIFYIDGRFIHYVNGAPAKEYYGNSHADGGVSINNCMPFFSMNYEPWCGYEYVNSPERKEKMITDECFTDGWVTYGEALYYAKPNGIKTGARIIDHEGQCLYFSYMSDAVILPGKSQDYTLTDGYLTLTKGEEISVSYTWQETELDRGMKMKYEAIDPEIAKIDKNGVITAVSEGLATFVASAVDEEGFHSYSALFQISVIPKKRTVNYSFEEEEHTHTYKKVVTKATLTKSGKVEKKCSECGYVKSKRTVYYPKTIKLSKTKYTYNGKKKTPSVIIKDKKGNLLKEGTDYTVKFSSKSRKSIGKYKVTVKFKGEYSGTKTLTFKIVPAKPTLSKLTAGKKQLTATWKPVSGATGYVIAYSTSKKFTDKTTKKVTVKKATAKKKTVKKLKKNKKYYVKVRAYKVVDGKRVYGSWSSVKSIRTK